MKDKEQRPIRFVEAEGKVDMEGAAQVLAIHFTQGDALLGMDE